jgi:hypothetical protein
MLTSCKKGASFVPNYDKPVGMIAIRKTDNLEQGKIAAKKNGYKYTFENIDAASVFYFDISSEESIAGSQKTYYLLLGSDETQGAAGATAKVAYKGTAYKDNTITAYYLYYDGAELFFDSSNPVLSEALTDGLVIKGEEYSCAMKFSIIKPVDSFTLEFIGDNDQQINELFFTPIDFEDYQQIQVPEGTASIYYTTFDTDKEVIETKILTSKDYNLNICFDDGGELLDCKTLRLMWEE